MKLVHVLLLNLGNISSRKFKLSPRWLVTMHVCARFAITPCLYGFAMQFLCYFVQKKNLTLISREKIFPLVYGIQNPEQMECPLLVNASVDPLKRV